MSALAGERLISADSHVKVTHEQIKANLATKFHQSYDDALASFAARMARGAGAANAAGAAMKAADSNAAFNRPGYWDPIARLADMDADGVDAEPLGEGKPPKLVGQDRKPAGQVLSEVLDVANDRWHRDDEEEG